MPNYQVSPGIRSTETDQATTSPSTTTDVGAFAGLFQWGPVEERTLIASNARNRNRSLEQRFGKPKRNFNQETWFVASSYLDYSSVLYVSRGIAPGTRNAVAGYGLGEEVSLGSWSTLGAAVTDVTAAGGFNLSSSALVLTLRVENDDSADRTFALQNIPAGSPIEIREATGSNSFAGKVVSVSVDTATSLATVTLDAVLGYVAADFEVFVSSVFASNQYRDTGKDTDTNGISDVVVKNFANFEDGKTAIDDRIKFASRWPGRLGNSIEVHVCDNKFAWGYDSSELGSDDNYWGEVATGDVTSATIKNAAGVALTGTNFPADLVVGRKFNINKLEIEISAVDTTAGTITFGTTNFGSALAATYALSTPDWTYRNSMEADVPGQSRTVEKAKNEDGGTYSVEDEIHIVVTDRLGEFTGVEGQITERWPSLSRYVESKGDTGGTLYYKDVVNRRSQYIWAVNDIEAAGEDGYTSEDIEDLADVSDVSASTKVFPMIGGHDGYNSVDTSGDPDPESGKANENEVALSGILSAFDAFRGGIDIDFLMAGKAQNSNPLVVQAHLRSIRAERGGDCVATISPPRDVVVNNPNREVQGMIDWAGGIQSDSYMVFDTGYKLMYDRYNDVNIYVPLNGDIAGLMSATNAPWISPAGKVKGQIRNAIGLAFNPDARGDRDRLYVSRINPVISQPGRGIYLYGDKTALARNSSFNRINVRRLFIKLKKIITDISEDTALFDNNDPVTRARFVNTVEPELRSIQGGRGISDFFVQCDGQNNPPEVEDDNEFIGDVYVKPRRSINYINLNFVSVRTGISFSEIAR